MADVESTYIAACEAAGVVPRVPISAPGPTLRANGNSDALRNNRLRDADIAPLTSALMTGHLYEELDLSYNYLSTTLAAEPLKNLLETDTQLRRLNLAQNELDVEAAQMLCKALKENSTLEELSLSGNKLGSSGGLALADLLQQSSSGLKHLALNDCELTTESLVALATVLQANDKLESLHVARSMNAPLMEEATSHFSRMLKVNSTLIELDLSHCTMRDLGLQLLAEELYRAGEESKLASLMLNGNQISLVDSACVNALSLLLGSKTCASPHHTTVAHASPPCTAGAASSVASPSCGLHPLCCHCAQNTPFDCHKRSTKHNNCVRVHLTYPTSLPARQLSHQ